MTVCQYLEPPRQAPCFSTATHQATLPCYLIAGVTVATPAMITVSVCDDHAQALRAQGVDVWPIEPQHSPA